MITLNKLPNQRVLELGGGQNRNPASDVNVDVRSGPGVDFACSFEEPLPIQTDEFDVVFSHFAFEHISWRNLPNLLRETLRVVKPAGRVIIAVPNTEEQIKWIESHPEGWDGKSAFESMSCILYGDQDYSDNTHKCYWSPSIAFQLFQQAGFVDIVIEPYGERKTDMAIMASKPQSAATISVIETPKEEPPPSIPEKIYTREEMYDKHYFNGGGKVGGYSREGYWDFPVHEITVQHIRNRKPESVLELGCARGYLLKRLRDRHNIQCFGIEISDHCKATRVCDNIAFGDVTNVHFWEKTFQTQGYDLAFSLAFFEHIPEELLLTVIEQMKRVCKRGLHGIDFGHKDDGFDRTHCTLRPKEWWTTIMPAGHEVVDKEELERGTFPQEVLADDGLIKLNIGSNTQMFHHNWNNCDILDLKGFAEQNAYKFHQFDLKSGIPYETESVDLVNMSHVLEHFSFKDALSILRDLRRVIKPAGTVRITVPDLDLFKSKSLDKIVPVLDALNMNSEEYTTPAMKLYHALTANHLSGFDPDTLEEFAKKAGFYCYRMNFDHFSSSRMQGQCFDMFPDISLFVDLIPITSQ